MCKGQCPGTAIDNDWRNRTEHCEVWKTLYRHLEAHMLDQKLNPISGRSDRMKLERVVLDAWARGQNMTIAHAQQRLSQEQSPGASAPPARTMEA
jgi:uncharacterized protein